MTGRRPAPRSIARPVKLLLDQNLSHRLVARLADVFPGSTQARLVRLDRAPDTELWDFAAREGYAIVSRDVDLAEMTALRGVLRW